MKELHFYLNRKKEKRDLLICIIFLSVLIFLRDKLIDFELNPIKSSFIIIGIALLFFIALHSVIFLLRTKPFVTVTETEIIIYRLFREPINVNFLDVKSFQILTTYHKGISTSDQILIELKNPTEKYSRTWFYKFLKLFGSKVANSQYGIVTTHLNIKSKELLKILNERIKK